MNERAIPYKWVFTVFWNVYKLIIDIILTAKSICKNKFQQLSRKLNFKFLNQIFLSLDKP